MTASRLLAMLLGCLILLSGCFVRTTPAHRHRGGGYDHPDRHRHNHCHQKKRHQVCHSHPHGGGHH